MQQEPTYNYHPQFVLPRRSTRKIGQISKFIPKQFIANYYDVKLNSSLNKVYLYEAKFPQDIPGDSTQVFIKCILQLKRKLQQTIKYVCFSGKIVYGFAKKTISQTYKCQVGDSSIEVQIKFNKQLSINDLLDDPKTRPMVFQFLNSKLKTCMRENNICQMGKVGAFYPKNQLLGRGADNIMNNSQKQFDNYQYLEQIGLNVLRGYKFTLVMINRQINLQLDVCSRVLQSRSLLQDLEDFTGNQQQMLHQYIGKTIITRYGNYKTHTIEDIDFSKNPNSTFKKNQEEIKFSLYFRKAYNIQVRHSRQPLIKVKAPQKKHISKKQKLMIAQTQQYIYLIPQLVSLTGMTDSQRANHQSMKALAPFTKLTPNDRFRQSMKIINLLNNSSQILEIKRQKQFNGFQVPSPTIGLNQNTQVRNGSILCRSKLMQPHMFSKWAFVYSVNHYQADFNQACVIQENLRQASKAYGINYVEPIYIQVQGRTVQDFLKTIQNRLSEFEARDIEICFVILKQKETTFYSKIKNLLVNGLGIPSQVIQAKSLTKSKNVMSIASKIAIQMSCKAGSAPWVVHNNVSYLKNKHFAYCSLSTSKGKGGFTVSFVGTINRQCTKVYSQYALKIKKKDQIDVRILKQWYIDWIKSYFKENNKKLPELLIFYRQSVGDSMFKTVVEHEISILKQSIEKVRQKASPKFNPEILYLFVNKKINSRFYDYDQYRDQFMNPEPGSVIIDKLSVDDQFDFHLAAQKVTQGTCTPTQYVVGYDESQISQEDIIQFTYNQCYNYYNWQGTVKVPSMLQCANKLSKLAGESIRSQFKVKKNSRISTSFYFL